MQTLKMYAGICVSAYILIEKINCRIKNAGVFCLIVKIIDKLKVWQCIGMGQEIFLVKRMGKLLQGKHFPKWSDMFMKGKNLRYIPLAHILT